MELLRSINERLNLTEGRMDPTADFPPHVVEQIVSMAMEHVNSGEAKDMVHAIAIALSDADLPGLDDDSAIEQAARNLFKQSMSKASPENEESLALPHELRFTASAVGPDFTVSVIDAESNKVIAIARAEMDGDDQGNSANLVSFKSIGREIDQEEMEMMWKEEQGEILDAMHMNSDPEYARNMKTANDRSARRG